MNKKSQIYLIKDFFTSNDKTIIINQVNDYLRIFYLSLTKYYADKQNIKINTSEDDATLGSSNDLFGLKEIMLFSITNSRKLTEVLDIQHKKIIFTDYKNFKKLNSKYKCINGYKFEQDISYFIRDELKIENDELTYFCKNNPALIISETSKYLINHRYAIDQSIVEEKNHILNIRKSVFEIKKNNLNIKNLYLNIKKEAEYKKLSFLTY